jgi:DNA-binding transcriptional ArsR family regulator
MEILQAVAVLAALAQESRLAVFRLLVQRGPRGLAAGAIAQRLGISAPTLSFHLSQLGHAGLVRSRREGRSIVYEADYAGMQELMSYLTENCCREDATACAVPSRQSAGTAFVARSEASPLPRPRGFTPSGRAPRRAGAKRSATHSGVRRAKRSVSSAAGPRIDSEGRPFDDGQDAKRSATHSGVRRAKRSISSAAGTRIDSEGRPFADGQDAKRSATHSGVRRAKRSVSSAATARIHSERSRSRTRRREAERDAFRK